jgi:uncharacterized MAPEG superfamily protein
MQGVMMQSAAMSTEIMLLGWSVVLLFLQLSLQAVLAVGELGLPYAMGSHDDRRQVQGIYAGRAERAFYNLLQTYAAFVALALALAVTGKTGGMGALGAQIWFWSRVAYVPLYLVGIPGPRTLAFAASVVGLAMMLIRLFS